jgi:hypothetical protein
MLTQTRTKRTGMTKYGRTLRIIMLPFEGDSILQGGEKPTRGKFEGEDALGTAGETPALQESRAKAPAPLSEVILCFAQDNRSGARTLR